MKHSSADGVSHTGFVTFQIRGMSIDEAMKQLSFVERKGSAVVKEVGSLYQLSQLTF